ncbi:MAG: CRISPR-associated endonuclease Cas1 [Dehalococcoidia bacterium]|nr:CRISPR-associated endonuclease Cas1 [Dehalococcoidia bacterium]
MTPAARRRTRRRGRWCRQDSPRRYRAAGSNALLNYCYAILGAECRLALLTMRLDPGMGVLHVRSTFTRLVRRRPTAMRLRPPAPSRSTCATASRSGSPTTRCRRSRRAARR